MQGRTLRSKMGDLDFDNNLRTINKSIDKIDGHATKTGEQNSIKKHPMV